MTADEPLVIRWAYGLADEDVQAAFALREDVFHGEQNVPLEEELEPPPPIPNGASGPGRSPNTPTAWLSSITRHPPNRSASAPYAASGAGPHPGQ